jgi:hypothetical protein
VNYYFNQLHRDRVWKAMNARGEFAGAGGTWTLSGETAGAEAVTFELSDSQASIRLPSGELRVDVAGDLAVRLDPPASGGLLTSLTLWRKLLVGGPEKFGEVNYWGSAPLAGYDHLLDVLAGTYRDVECRWYVDPADGQLVAMEMFPEEDADPCELYFTDYHEVEGRQLPGRLEVRHGDGLYQVYELKQAKLDAAPEKSE